MTGRATGSQAPRGSWTCPTCHRVIAGDRCECGRTLHQRPRPLDVLLDAAAMDGVRLRRPVDGHPAGATGRVVKAARRGAKATILVDLDDGDVERLPERCRCRPPRRHRDCMYCGTSWAGEVVCGVCRAAGIDGRVIRGTSGAVCSRHRSRD